MRFFFIFFYVISQIKAQKEETYKASYSLVTNYNKFFSFKYPYYYLKKKSFPNFTKKLFGYNDMHESNWYYVHFLTKNIQDIQNIIDIKIKDIVLKNTFILYLQFYQLKMIQNISLVKKLEPSDKFFEDGGPIESTNFFHVTTAPNFILPSNIQLYSIFRQDDSQTYIIKINDDGLSPNKLNKRKKEAVNFLTSINSVKFVTTFTLPEPKNNINIGYTQKNSPIGQILKNKETEIQYMPRYVNEQGITGKGQAITIQDTPIDPNHIMFRDDDQKEFNFNQQILNHRKFVYYGNANETFESLLKSIQEKEHGTHVAATAAGKSLCDNNNEITSSSLFNGNAPDAKILYAGGINDISANNVTALMYELNSQISTNSWGVRGSNNMLNNRYGSIAYQNPQLLFIFAAGNEYDAGNFSVCDPGGSKNVLTVGAIDDFYESVKTYKIQSIDDRSILFTAYALLDVDPFVEASIGQEDSGLKMVVINADEKPQCLSVFGQHVSLMYGTKFDSDNWIFKCKVKRSRGILYTGDKTSVEWLLEIGGKVQITDISSLNESKPITHSRYSSAGPANMGIIKPDIVAPGTRIISANSHNETHTSLQECSQYNEGMFTYMSGSSMATSNIAGAVALLREFFLSGMWIGRSVSLNSATMRALMINSCRHPNGEKKPDNIFGHGVVDLSTVLPFDESFGVQITNQSSSPVIYNGDHLVTQIEVKSNQKDFQVTLSYLDPMLDVSSVIPIVHDIDLVVVSSSGRRFLGDNLYSNDTQHFSTNEKVLINRDEIETGVYYVHVVAGPFLDSEMEEKKQEFSVVATGDIENKIMSFGTPTKNQTEKTQVFVNQCPCEVCDGENETKCLCDRDHIGPLCQASIIRTDSKASLLIHPSEIGRIKVSRSKGVNTINVKVIDSKGGNSSLWIDDECHVSVGEYKTYIDPSSFLSGKIKLSNTKKDFCVAIFNNNYESATYEIDFSLKKLNVGMIVGIVLGILGYINIIFILVLLIYNKVFSNCCKCRRKKAIENGSNKGEIHHEMIDELIKKMKEKDDKILKLKLSISKLTKTNQDDAEVILQLNNKLNDKNQEITQFQSINDELNTKLSKLTNKMYKHACKNILLKNQIQRIEGENSTLRQNNIILEQKIRRKNEEISCLNRQNSELKNAHDQINNNMAELMLEKSEYARNIEDQKNEIILLKSLIDNLKNDLNDATIRIETLNIENKNLEKKLKLKNTNIKFMSFLSIDDFTDLEEKTEICRGATSIVYSVTQKVKRALKESKKTDFKTNKKFFTENEVLSILDHPNIIKTYGFFQGNEDYKESILLEYCPTNLSKIVRTIDKQQQISIILSLCSAMKYVHSMNIIHSDLKLENILMDPKGNVKLCNFGGSFSFEESLTDIGRTRRYMAPELSNKETDIDEKIDVYSFGVVVFRILTKGGYPSRKTSDVISGKEIEIPDYITKFSSKLITLCMSPEPRNRPSFEEIYEKLKKKGRKLVPNP